MEYSPESQGKGLQNQMRRSNMDKIARELVMIAKNLLALDTKRVVDGILNMLEDVQSLDRDTFSAEEWAKFQKEFGAIGAGDNHEEYWEMIDSVRFELSRGLTDPQDIEDNCAVKVSELPEDYSQLSRLFAKYEIRDRLRNPAKYLDKERSFKEKGLYRNLYSKFPSWLQRLMIDNDIDVTEDILGEYFEKRGKYLNEDPLNGIDELVEWAEKNKHALT